MQYADLLERLNAAWSRQAVIRENEILGPDHLIKAAADAVLHVTSHPMLIEDAIQDVLVELIAGKLEAVGLRGHPAIRHVVANNFALLLPFKKSDRRDPFGNPLIETLPHDTPLYHEAIVTK